MIIKLEKVISCTSEHPSYPASNLLQQRTNLSWRCAKPGELLVSVIFQVAEPSTITGLDIGNYRSCIVVVTASTAEEPDNWVPVINHQFMTHEEAANGKFKDQVQLFTKKELNAETLKIKFSRVKVTCMQSANRRELFGLTFIVLRTEVVPQLGADIFGRFKLKNNASETLDDFKAKCMKQVVPKITQSYKESLAQKVKEEAANNFAKRQESPKALPKRPILEKLEKEERKEDEAEVNKPSKRDERSPLEEVVSEPMAGKLGKKNAKRRSVSQNVPSDDEAENKPEGKCADCANDVSEDNICQDCNKLPPQKPIVKKPRVKKRRVITRPLKEFHKLFEDVSFALSGYVNPQRDDIRRQALKMGARYVADPNTTTNKCSHLICAFHNTPKSQQLRNHTRIVTHKFIEDCYDKKKRLPWRRYAMDPSEKAQPESEEEIEGTTSRILPPDPYKQDTDLDSDE